MRVFVTGATGFIGFAIVRELLDAGHQVTGLARSQASAARLLQAGAQVCIGGVEDLDLLRSAAREADGAIHTAFYHKVSHIPLALRLRVLLGGAPGGIVRRFLTTAVTTDRRTVETIGQVFAGSGRPLVATFATLAMQPGRLAAEEDALDPAFVGAPRAQTEETMQALASRRVRTTIIRLPPIVHGAGDRGFALRLVETARKKKLSAYIGDGTNRWPSVHRLDAARLYRLALESGPAGGTCHGVAEEGIPFREIAAVIGRRLHLPVAGIPPAQAAGHFGFLAPFIPRDNPTSSRQTRQRLGWEPTQPGLLADLEQADYFTS